MGPLLFLIYINDIVIDIESNIRLFADDTSLFLIVDGPDSSVDPLKNDIDKISSWALKWNVSFNPTKSESLVISRRAQGPNRTPLVMQTHQILEVDSHKHLGLIFDKNGSWHSQLIHIVEKAWKRIAVMRKLKFQLDRKTLENIYTTFIRPLLEYGDIVWDNCTATEKLELNKIQNEASRIATGATALVSLNELKKEIGWVSLEDRRKEHKLILMYKMINNSSPQYLSSLVPPLVGEVSQYNLRNSRSLTLPRCRTKLYSDSFLPSTVRDWNDLPDEIKALPSINRFKKAIRHTQTKPPPYYYTGTRRLQVLHTRLRTGCSSLNSHLFSKNVIDSPLCLCGAAETVHHYFFVCPTYLNLRQILINSVSNIANPSINLFLYGEGTLTIEANTKIFQHVQSYIDQTKRF